MMDMPQGKKKGLSTEEIRQMRNESKEQRRS